MTNPGIGIQLLANISGACVWNDKRGMYETKNVKHWLRNDVIPVLESQGAVNGFAQIHEAGG